MPCPISDWEAMTVTESSRPIRTHAVMPAVSLAAFGTEYPSCGIIDADQTRGPPPRIPRRVNRIAVSDRSGNLTVFTCYPGLGRGVMAGFTATKGHPNGRAGNAYERTRARIQRTSWLVDLSLFNIVTPR